MAITFYTNPMSRGRIARWMLEELGQPYETVLTDWQEKPDALRRANPLAKVPTIDHDGTIVTEAAAICLYLADAFPDAGLKPTGDALAPYYRWTLFCAGPLEAAMMDRHLGVEVPGGKEAMVGYGNFDRTIDALESAVAGRRYIAGDTFTAADVYVGSAIAFFTGFGMLEKRDAFTRYLDGLRQREAWQRAIAIDDALMAEQKS
jgi:glutathione S-transferase